MKKTVKVTTAAICAIMLASPLTLLASAESQGEYKASGEYITEISQDNLFSGNSYLDLSQKSYSGVRVLLDGKDIISGQGRIINSVTYVPLRAFCDALGGATISWDQPTRTAKVSASGLTVYAKQGALYLQANDRYFYTGREVIQFNGEIYVPILPMTKALNSRVQWREEVGELYVSSGDTRRLKTGAQVYNADEVFWLARIISAESRGEPMKGKLAVGNVILNRVRSSSFPNTIYGVIFDKKYGTQFSPVANGTIYNTPTVDSIIAAKMCLEGYSLSSDVLYFVNPTKAPNSWIAQNRTYAFTVGNHAFFE